MRIQNNESIQTVLLKWNDEIFFIKSYGAPFCR